MHLAAVLIRHTADGIAADGTQVIDLDGDALLRHRIAVEVFGDGQLVALAAGGARALAWARAELLLRDGGRVAWRGVAAGVDGGGAVGGAVLVAAAVFGEGGGDGGGEGREEGEEGGDAGGGGCEMHCGFVCLVFFFFVWFYWSRVCRYLDGWMVMMMLRLDIEDLKPYL